MVINNVRCLHSLNFSLQVRQLDSEGEEQGLEPTDLGRGQDCPQIPDPRNPEFMEVSPQAPSLSPSSYPQMKGTHRQKTD